jgi:N-acyl-D-aspartate/D-glutamate deacylase
LAVIDLSEIRDASTFVEPHQYAEGVEYVLVNGAFVVDGGALTWALPGRVLTPSNSQKRESN